MPRNNNSSTHTVTRRSSERLSGYVLPREKSWWEGEVNRVSDLEGLRNVGMGTLMSRISRFKLRLDLEALQEYAKVFSGREAISARK